MKDSSNYKYKFFLFSCLNAAISSFCYGNWYSGFSFFEGSKAEYTRNDQIMQVHGLGLNLGGFFGSLAICPIAKKYGRIKSFYISQAIMIVGCIIVIFIKTCAACFEEDIDSVYIIGRVIKGIACGIDSLIVPLYSKVYAVREIAPIELAGALGSIHPIMKSLGVCCSVFLFLSITEGIAHSLLHLLPIFLCILQFILFQRYFNYESPSYLWLSNRRNEAIYQINRLYFNESKIRTTVFTKLAILYSSSRRFYNNPRYILQRHIH